jgi:hypothetical protein
MDTRFAFTIIELAAIAVIPIFGQISEDLKRKLDEVERNTHVESLVPVDIAPEESSAE